MKNSNEKQVSGKSRFITVIALVIALALVVSGIIAVSIYNTKLKPADFSVVSQVQSGDGTGYYRHCYEELNEDEKKVYSVVLESIYDMPERIEIPELASGNLDKIFTALSYDNPDLFSLGLTCSVYEDGLKTFFEPSYIMSAEDYAKMSEEVDGIVSAIILGTEPFTSVYEKELYVHDYLITHCSYSEPTESGLENTVYGCLVEGKASCEGYSRAFQYIMNQIGIDNRLITGEACDTGEEYIAHMWNYVVVGGDGYFVDLTWDDPKSEGSVLKHTYFNVTTNDILISHRNLAQTVPLCTATRYNYFQYENNYITVASGTQFEETVENAVLAAIGRGYKCVELRFADGALMEQGKNSLFNTGVVYNVYDSAGILENKADSKVYYSADEKMNTICLFF